MKQGKAVNSRLPDGRLGGDVFYSDTNVPSTNLMRLMSAWESGKWKVESGKWKGIRMKIELDGLSISSEQEFHQRIASTFSVTQYYGNNLNALWDLLSTEVERPIELIWNNSEFSEERMGDSYRKILIILDRVKNQDESFALDEKFSYQLK